MKKEEPVDDSSKLLDLASRWSIYTWVSIIFGFFVSKFKITYHEELGWTLILAGVIFAIISLCISVYGLVTKEYRRALFIVPIIMSLPPLISLAWITLGK
ncbi:MAG: hypothetical protein KAI74_01605 [Kiritimatiellae bacterium]|nr:hypothetical protein [Kiritimatiellia bacterium]